MYELEQRIEGMANTMLARRREDPRALYPAWSTGELLMVALVLNDAAMLKAEGYSILEALQRVDLDAAQLQAIARRVR